MRLPVWRLTRNRYGRAAYDALAAVGVTATKMYLYRTEVDEELSRCDPPDGLAVDICARDPASLDPSTYADFADPEPEDVAVVAERGDRIVGYLFLTADRPKRVEPLAATFEFPGAYVWRVFVAPERRGEGIATALVGRALRVARREWGVDTACALVALDNRPSQWVFENNGFERRELLSYYRVAGVERRTREPVSG